MPPQDEYDVTKGFTYMYVNGEPLFPFGHGLSYTTFEYQGMQAEPAPDGTTTVRVIVKNAGERRR